jgi:hypothetical protein
MTAKYMHYKNRIADQHNAYASNMDLLAYQIFETEILPILVTNNLLFIAAERKTWSIYNVHGDNVSSTLSSDLLGLLNFPIPGLDRRLGSLMPDFWGEQL